MPTKMYFHDAAAADDPGTLELSGNLPGGDAFQDFGKAPRSMNTTIGVLQFTSQANSIPNAVETSSFFTSFSSPALERDITAETWTLAVEVSEGNNAANSFCIPIIYTFRPSDSSTRFVIDTHAQLGTEWNAGATQGVVITFGGAAVTIVAGDFLVFEMWRHTLAQAMSMGYLQQFDFDGTTEPTQGSGVSSAASYLETPQDNLFTPDAAPSHDYIPVGVRHKTMARILNR